MCEAISVAEQFFGQVHEGEEPGYDPFTILCQTASSDEQHLTSGADLDDFDHAARRFGITPDPVVAETVFEGIVASEVGCDCFCEACQRYYASVGGTKFSSKEMDSEEKFDQPPCMSLGSCPFPVHGSMLEETTTWLSSEHSV